METLKYSFVAVLAFLTAGNVWAAPEFGVALETGFLAGDAVQLKAHVSALTVTDKDFVRKNWLDYLEWSAADANGQPVALTVTSTKSEERTEFRDVARTRGVRQDLWTAEGKIVLAPLPVGETTITVRYRTLSQTVKVSMFKGDENKEVIDAKLRRDAEAYGTSYEKYRELQLKRLELRGEDQTILWELAARSQRWAPIEETTSYYVRAIEAERARLAALRASGNEGYRRHAEQEQAGFELRERMAAAILSLLPEYCKNREGLAIRTSFREMTVELLEGPSMRVIKVIDVSRVTPDFEKEMGLLGGPAESTKDTLPTP